MNSDIITYSKSGYAMCDVMMGYKGPIFPEHTSVYLFYQFDTNKTFVENTIEYGYFNKYSDNILRYFTYISEDVFVSRILELVEEFNYVYDELYQIIKLPIHKDMLQKLLAIDYDISNKNISYRITNNISSTDLEFLFDNNVDLLFLVINIYILKPDVSDFLLDKYYQRILDYGLDNFNYYILSYLIRYGFPYSNKIMLKVLDHYDCIDLILKYPPTDFDINYSNSLLLTYAIWNKKKQDIENLLNSGAMYPVNLEKYISVNAFETNKLLANGDTDLLAILNIYSIEDFNIFKKKVMDG